MNTHHHIEKEPERQSHLSSSISSKQGSSMQVTPSTRLKLHHWIVFAAIMLLLVLIAGAWILLIPRVLPHPTPTAIQLSHIKDSGRQVHPPATWDIEYVQISGLANQAMQSAINARLREASESVKEQLLSHLASDTSNTSVSTVTMTVAGSSLTERFLSVGYWGSDYYGGAAHEVAHYTGLNFDLRSGKLLTNRDLVNPGHTGSGDLEHNILALREAVFELVQSQLGTRGCSIDQNKLIGKADDPSPLFFTAQGAGIGYPNYMFGANPCGFPPALIPYTKLDSILNPDYFPYKQSIVMTRAENGQSVHVHSGDTVILQLYENASTGYTWMMNKTDTGILALQNSTYTPSGTMPGSGGIRVFTFLARNVGMVHLQLKYWRSFEGDSSIIERYNVTVEVQR